MDIGSIFEMTKNLNAMVVTFFLGMASWWWLTRDKGKEKGNGEG
jgi:hypothetical protein